eukprot:9464310-Alexandrium_andersonii.AAC.1
MACPIEASSFVPAPCCLMALRRPPCAAVVQLGPPGLRPYGFRACSADDSITPESASTRPAGLYSIHADVVCASNFYKVRVVRQLGGQHHRQGLPPETEIR